MLTATITELGMTEKWFWENEPKKVCAMLDEKTKIDKAKAQLQALYVSCYLAGVDPEEKEKGVAGVDKPVNESLLKMFE